VGGGDVEKKWPGEAIIREKLLIILGALVVCCDKKIVPKL